MTEYDFFGYLVLSIYFGFVIILGIIVFMLVNMQRLKKEMANLKKDVSISIEKETVELKMDILMVIESELVKMKKSMPAEFDSKLVKLKKEMSAEMESKLNRIKNETFVGTEREVFKLNKNICEGIAALVNKAGRVVPKSAKSAQEISSETFTRRG